MIKHNQDGAINQLLVPLVLAVILFMAALGFGFWAFAGKEDFKNNTDQKIAAAVAVEKQAEGASKDKQYAELAKSPYKVYNGPEQYGSIALTYPKTWSAYVDIANGAAPFDGFFNPDVVPSATDQNSTFALRIQVLNQAYDQVLRNIDTQNGLTVTPYALPKLPKIIGVRADGQIENDKQGSMILLPVRDKTLKIYTEVDAYKNDFNNIILPNLTFAP